MQHSHQDTIISHSPKVYITSLLKTQSYHTAPRHISHHSSRHSHVTQSINTYHILHGVPRHMTHKYFDFVQHPSTLVLFNSLQPSRDFGKLIILCIQPSRCLPILSKLAVRMDQSLSTSLLPPEAPKDGDPCQ